MVTNLMDAEGIVPPLGRAGNIELDLYPLWPNQDRVHSIMTNICVYKYFANVVMRLHRL